jgi:hypothetical protein
MTSRESPTIGAGVYHSTDADECRASLVLVTAIPSERNQ